jgi:superfamily II DNA/RNA helicase
MGIFRHGLAPPSNSFKTLWQSSVRFLSQLKPVVQDSRQLCPSPPFARLGLSKAVSLGLASAFPAITRATDAQATFIPAILQGKDVMLKGHTGSGKCVGTTSYVLSSRHS